MKKKTRIEKIVEKGKKRIDELSKVSMTMNSRNYQKSEYFPEARLDRCLNFK